MIYAFLAIINQYKIVAGTLVFIEMYFHFFVDILNKLHSTIKPPYFFTFNIF